MLGIGNIELIIIALFGFLLLGPDKLPVMGRVLGRALRQFRSAQEDITKVMQSEFVDPLQQAATKVESSNDTDSSESVRPKRETFAERKERLAALRTGDASRMKNTVGTTDSALHSPSAHDKTDHHRGSVSASHEESASAQSQSAGGQTQDAPFRDAPVRDAPVRDAPVRDASVRDAPVQDAQDVSASDHDSQELSAFALYGLTIPSDEEDGKA